MVAAWKKSVPHVILLLYVAAILYPFVFVIFSSLKVSNQSIASNPWGFPFDLKFENYITTWVEAKINVYFINSFYLATSAAIIGVLLAAAMAFAITRMKFGKLSSVLTQLVLVGLLIPGNALFISQYILVKDLHILNTHWALFFPYVAGAIPTSVLLIAAFMRSIPRDLEEAAIMDGLNAVGLFFKIVFPLTVPALVTVFIINFLGNWNEFLLANFFLNKDILRTLPVGMVGFRDTYQTNYAQVCAGIVYSVLPVLIIYAILQEKIIEGLTAGSVKG
ncbi:carbohydrate ABC transporter permease [Paenibacillus sp. FSL K6-3182]|uniref:carbohydrate ABC transporter permease n=1 Tax=Paenibacillus sp. FSL K6-3182 TaxID=2921495 RepID=UPI0030D52DB4